MTDITIPPEAVEAARRAFTGSEYVAMRARAAELAKEITSLLNRLADERTENMRLRAGNEDMRHTIHQWEPNMAALRAENERFKAALGHIADERLSSSDEVQYLKQFARSVLDDQSERSPWRSIETAPKDGTEVLMVFVFEDGETLHRVVRWDGSEMWPWRDEYTGYREGEAKGWMPLPPAPGKEEA